MTKRSEENSVFHKEQKITYIIFCIFLSQSKQKDKYKLVTAIKVQRFTAEVPRQAVVLLRQTRVDG